MFVTFFFNMRLIPKKLLFHFLFRSHFGSATVIKPSASLSHQGVAMLWMRSLVVRPLVVGLHGLGVSSVVSCMDNQDVSVRPTTDLHRAFQSYDIIAKFGRAKFGDHFLQAPAEK